MTTATRIERAVPAIRAALSAVAPADLAEFEAEFLRALAQSGERFDLAPLEAVLDRWWGIAAIRANPLTDRERELLARARAGDDTGWVTREQGGPRAPR